MAPLREKTYINPAHCPCWPFQSPSAHIGSTYTYIHTYIHKHTHIHTPTHIHNTGSVIQSVKSIWCVSWLAAGGKKRVQQTGRWAKVSMTVTTAAVCTREVRKGSDTVKRSMSHCTSWTKGTVAPGSPVCTDVTAPERLGGGTKVDDDNCPCSTVVQRSLSSSSTRQLSPPSPSHKKP